MGSRDFDDSDFADAEWMRPDEWYGPGQQADAAGAKIGKYVAWAVFLALLGSVGSAAALVRSFG